MSKAWKLPPVIPDEDTTRVFGRLTIIIASVLLCFNFYVLGFYIAVPIMKPLSQRFEKWGTRVVQQEVEKKAAKIEKLKQAANNPADQAKLAAIQKRPTLQFNSMSLSFGAADSPQVRAYGIADGIVGLILNTVMLFGAIGLVSLKPSGYKTTWWIAWIKLARIVLFGILMMAWIMPIQLRDMKAKMAGAFRQQPGAPVPALLTLEGMAAMTTSVVVLFALLATVYPILLLVQLRKARIKAACGIFPDDGGLA